MHLQVEDFEVYVRRVAKRNRDYSGPGWFWQETTLPPRGPFASVGDALRDLTTEIESGRLRADVKARLAEFAARRAAKG